MYNIKRNGREDYLLGLSVLSPMEAMEWLLYYQVKYPEYHFTIVVTDYAGDMAGLRCVA